ncbi:unnamed protein product [Cuscuta epithymum]|uniref:SNRNP25 ubiquitin-like domain-containing protein n=1 Tax=Cuscuta epithymum TaxID=186058 RepID=A0AAV0FVS3_9ASTE|nr:unnamed protein product [Cuscuta epithymum]
MSSIDYQNRGRFSIWAPLSLYNVFIIRSSSYQKLPSEPLKLSVLKLDGSSFVVNVPRNATVADLKLAIEQVFDFSCEGEDIILWSLVWSQFCLCYAAQKLTNDKACVRSLGIKDGDQLQFMRHMMIEGIECKTEKQPSKSAEDHPDQYSVINICEASQSNNMCLNNKQNTCFEIVEEKRKDTMHAPEFKFAHLVKGWLKQPKFWHSKGKGLRECNRPSVFRCQWVRS